MKNPTKQIKALSIFLAFTLAQKPRTTKHNFDGMNVEVNAYSNDTVVSVEANGRSDTEVLRILLKHGVYKIQIPAIEDQDEQEWLQLWADRVGHAYSLKKVSPYFYHFYKPIPKYDGEVNPVLPDRMPNAIRLENLGYPVAEWVEGLGADSVYPIETKHAKETQMSCGAEYTVITNTYRLYSCVDSKGLMRYAVNDGGNRMIEEKDPEFRKILTSMEFQACSLLF